MINLAILDDHQIVIDGLKMLLESDKELVVAGEYTNGFRLLDDLKAGFKPDLLLMDLVMPAISGMEMALILKKEFPQLKVIILSMQIEGKIIFDLIEDADIKGFIPKSANKEVLIACLHRVFNNEQFFTDEILAEADRYRGEKRERERFNFSCREIEILKLIAVGLTNREIGEKLYISEFTVATHRKNIMRKSNAKNSTSLLNLAREQKLI